MLEEDVNQREAGTPAGGDVEPDRTEAGRAEMDDQEAMRRLQEEIGRLPVADHIVLMMHSLSSLVIERLGLTPEGAVHRDLEQARLAIDAFKALVGVLEDRRPAEEITAHRSVLSELQMAYVGCLSAAPADEAAEAADGADSAP
jgi:hypothetical protein